METEHGRDTSRTVVKTYVPAYQREEWDERADDLGMSRSEFVRTMVQAGKRGFEAGARTPPEESDGGGGEDRDSEGAPVSDDDLRATILEALSTDRYLSWDELLAAVTDDIEARLEERLQALQAADEVRYSGPNGGYTLEE